LMKRFRPYRSILLGIFQAVLIWSVSTISVTASERITADDLEYYTENFPPHNYMENGQLKGISVDILEMMWAKLGSGKTRADISILPWARAIRMLKTHSDMVLFGMGYSEERAEKFHWVGPYFTHELALIGRADDPVSIDRIDDARHLTIGVVRQDIGHQTLIERSFHPDRIELCDDIAQLHQKFVHHRFRVVCYVTHAYFNYLQRQDIPRHKFKKLFTISASKSGFGFSRKVPLDLINRFQGVLERLRAEGELDNVLNRYGMK